MLTHKFLGHQKARLLQYEQTACIPRTPITDFATDSLLGFSCYHAPQLKTTFLIDCQEERSQEGNLQEAAKAYSCPSRTPSWVFWCNFTVKIDNQYTFIRLECQYCHFACHIACNSNEQNAYWGEALLFQF